MVLWYDFGDEFSYEVSQFELEEFLQYKLSNYTLKELVKFIVDNEGETIEEIFYEPMYDYFEEKARKLYKESLKDNENPYNQSDFI